MLEVKDMTEEDFRKGVGTVRRKGEGQYRLLIERAAAGEFARLDCKDKAEAHQKGSQLQLARRKLGYKDRIVIAIRGVQVFVGPMQKQEASDEG